MATDSVMGLFTDPQQYQQAQYQQALDRNIKLAQLDPFERATALVGTGAYQLGGAIGGALGVQDSQLQALSTIKELSNKYDTNTSGGVAALATELQNRGMTQQAFQFGQKALEMRKLEAEAQAKTMEKLTTEQKNAAAIADSSGSPRGTPEWTSTYKAELNRLTTGAAQIDKVGVAAATREPVYFDKSQNVQFIVKTDPATGKQVRVPYNGGIDQTTSRTNVNVNPGETEFVKELGKLDAKKVSEAFTVRENASNAINSLNKLASLPDQDLISGQFASGRVGATNLLTTLGLASPTDANKLANSQQYQKVAGDVILQTLGGKLGSGFSNADRDFIASLVPQLETNSEARRKLITFMQGKNQDIIKESTRLENYARQNKGLNGFEPKIPMSVAPAAPNPYSGLSDAELAAKIAAAKAQQQRK